MSSTLRVTLDGLRLDASGESHIRNLYGIAAKAAVPPSMVPSIRWVFRNESHGTTIEPFLGSASFEALLGLRKKRNDAIALLRTLVACAFAVGEHVGVLYIRDGGPLPRERTVVSLENLDRLNCRNLAWYRITAPLRWTHFRRVEARLLRPLGLPNGERATHYFREFWVRAVDRQLAHDMVTMSVAEDGATIADFGEAVEEVPAAAQLGTRANVLMGGRIYFPDLSARGQ